MKYGVFSVSTPEYYPLELMEVAAKIGYNGIEWRVVEDKGDKSKPGYWSGNRSSLSAEEIISQAQTLSTKANSLGINMLSLASYINNDNLHDVELHFRAANSIGAKNVRIAPNRYDSNNGKYIQQITKCRTKYEKVAELAKKFNVRAIIETHPEDLCPSTYKIMAVLNDLNPEHVGIAWDPCNQLYEGSESHEMALDIMGEYLAEVHIKNSTYKTDKDGKMILDYCQIDKGLIDWKKIVNLLKKQKYDGWLILEDFSREKPVDEKLRFNLECITTLVNSNQS